MFDWMMGFAMIERCWDWRSENVECELVPALCCLFAVVLKPEEIRIVAGFEVGQEESALAAHPTMQTVLVQQCMLDPF
jgi:hypothetical protein